MRHPPHLALVLAIVLLSALPALAGGGKAAQEDVKAAIDEVGKQCKHLIKVKKIDWKKVGKEAKKEAKKAKDLQTHYEALVRIIAKLRDGHAYVKPANGVQVSWPGMTLKSGPGLYFCRHGDKIYVKNAWSNAARKGIQAGDEVVKIEGQKALDWLEARHAAIAEFASFSTPHQGFFFTCHWGLCGKEGEPFELHVKAPGKSAKKVKVARGRASGVPSGPVFPPKDLQRIGRQSYGTTANGFGYIHLRDTKRALPEQMDTMLAALGNVPGLILDFRANGGGGFDHDGVLGRFVPSGKELKRAKAYPIPSAGDTPYGGPIVVLIDAGTRSAGETGSGMFKEDGRAYMIGESPTAGMSSSKTTIELPSGQFSLYVSVRSNKGRFQGGRGIEGIGIEPHETVPYDPAHLAAGKDTLIERAEALLADFPKKGFPKNPVPYDPEKYGWTASR